MITVVPDVLDTAALAQVRARLEEADWTDGNATSGSQSAMAKRNSQLAEEGEDARILGGIVLDALARSALFVAAALPLKVYPPLFNSYAAGDAFGPHVDTAVRIRRGSDFRVRSDLSATLFLADPDSYDGGALVFDDGLEPRRVKLPAGQLLLYPASTVHHVEPVTRGHRLASVFWVQSMVRDGVARAELFALDQAIQSVAGRLGQDDPAVIRLTGTYHNLLRRWADS